MHRSLFLGFVITLVGLMSCDASAQVYRWSTISGQSASGFTYTGTGTLGLPGTTNPDSRRRAKVYNDFATFDTSTVGDTLSMSYDILLGGDADPGNESQDWRFGFVSTSANVGKGVSLGANFDIGDLAGTTAYEFFTDQAVTTGTGTPPSGEMDSAFTDTLNDPVDGTSRFAQSNADPFGDDVALNDRVDTNRITLTLARIADGYDLSLSWQNLTSGNTINHAYSLTTSDPDPVAAAAASITSWDRLGFFINDDSLDASSGPYVYTLSNVSVEGNAASLALASMWSVNEAQIPEPTSLLLMLLGTSAIVSSRWR